jgi:hypothetical protein
MGVKRQVWMDAKTRCDRGKRTWEKQEQDSLPSPFFFSLGITTLVFFFLRSWSIVDLEEFYSFYLTVSLSSGSYNSHVFLRALVSHR